mmetsp:Transcript_10254/g.19706  ORF Transcript_10254/g.19706 Transcript_10254/m.19706 type:complete len:129 (+) Transcript_10254:794-1180(+)
MCQKKWAASSARGAKDLSPVREQATSAVEKKWSSSARKATDDAPVQMHGTSSGESSPGQLPDRTPPHVPELKISASTDSLSAGFRSSSTLSSPRTPRSMSGKLLQRRIYAVGLGQATANVCAVLKTLI